MSTINELLEELRIIKANLRAGINNAYGYEAISEDECLGNYYMYMHGLCPCSGITYCVNFSITEGDLGTIVPSICGIPRLGCIEELPTPPEDLPGGIWEGYEFIGWKFNHSDPDCVTLDDICPITKDITLYAYYEQKSYTYTFMDAYGSIAKTVSVTTGATLGASTPPTIDVPAGSVLLGWDYIDPVSGQTIHIPDPNNFYFVTIPYNLVFFPHFGGEPTQYKVSVDYDDTQTIITIN